MSAQIPDAELDLVISESPAGRVYTITATTPAAEARLAETLIYVAATRGGKIHRDFWSMVLQYREQTPDWFEDET